MRKTKAAAILAIVGGLIYVGTPILFFLDPGIEDLFDVILDPNWMRPARIYILGFLGFGVFCIRTGLVLLLRSINSRGLRGAGWLMLVSSLQIFIINLVLTVPELITSESYPADWGETDPLIGALPTVFAFPFFLVGGILALVASRRKPSRS